MPSPRRHFLMIPHLAQLHIPLARKVKRRVRHIQANAMKRLILQRGFLLLRGGSGATTEKAVAERTQPSQAKFVLSEEHRHGGHAGADDADVHLGAAGWVRGVSAVWVMRIECLGRRVACTYLQIDVRPASQNASGLCPRCAVRTKRARLAMTALWAQT